MTQPDDLYLVNFIFIILISSSAAVSETLVECMGTSTTVNLTCDEGVILAYGTTVGYQASCTPAPADNCASCSQGVSSSCSAAAPAQDSCVTRASCSFNVSQQQFGVLCAVRAYSNFLTVDYSCSEVNLTTANATTKVQNETLSTESATDGLTINTTANVIFTYTELITADIELSSPYSTGNEASNSSFPVMAFSFAVSFLVIIIMLVIFIGVLIRKPHIIEDMKTICSCHSLVTTKGDTNNTPPPKDQLEDSNNEYNEDSDEFYDDELYQDLPDEQNEELYENQAFPASDGQGGDIYCNETGDVQAEATRSQITFEHRPQRFRPKLPVKPIPRSDMQASSGKNAPIARDSGNKATLSDEDEQTIYEDYDDDVLKTDHDSIDRSGEESGSFVINAIYAPASPFSNAGQRSRDRDIRRDSSRINLAISSSSSMYAHSGKTTALNGQLELNARNLMDDIMPQRDAENSTSANANQISLGGLNLITFPLEDDANDIDKTSSV